MPNRNPKPQAATIAAFFMLTALFLWVCCIPAGITYAVAVHPIHWAIWVAWLFTIIPIIAFTMLIQAIERAIRNRHKKDPMPVINTHEIFNSEDSK